MEVEITPEPTEAERRAITAALAATEGLPAAYTSAWRARALDVGLRDDALAQEGGRDAGVVEP
jgi:hypothetical protein